MKTFRNARTNWLPTKGADLEPDKVEEMIESCTHYLLWLQKHYRADEGFLETRLKDLKARLIAIFTKQRKQKFQEARINLEKCLLNCDERLPTTRKLSEHRRKVLTELCEQHKEWLKTDPNDVTACVYRLKNLEGRISRYIAEHAITRKQSKNRVENVLDELRPCDIIWERVIGVVNRSVALRLYPT
jgi:hypothetical protein